MRREEDEEEEELEAQEEAWRTALPLPLLALLLLLTEPREFLASKLVALAVLAVKSDMVFCYSQMKTMGEVR